jgi:uncharacterized LabA/DUF88 family protein
MDERVCVFIDGANLFYALRDKFDRIDLDFEVLAYKLVGERKLIRTYYYTALPDQAINPDRYQKQQKFLAALRDKNYFKVVLGRLEKRGETYVEKGVDIALAVDLLEQAYTDIYDTAILISGDGDLAKAVEVIQRLGKHVENACIKGCLSSNLRQTCDKVIELDDAVLSDCWMKKR